MKKIFVICILLLYSLFSISCIKKTDKKEKIKVAFLYLNQVGDSGWTYAHEQGRLAIKDLDIVEKTIAIENMNTTEKTEQALKQFADQGYDLIFATSYEHAEAVFNVASNYPSIVFMHCRDSGLSYNVGSYIGRLYEANYLAGISAGYLTNSNKIGIVASEPIAEVVRNINSYARGIANVNQNARLYVKWTNSWDDPIEESKAVDALVKNGCDIILQNLDTANVQIEAAKHNVLSIGFNCDMSNYAPNTHITAPVWNWAVLYDEVIKQVYNKTWQSEAVDWGLKSGLVGLSPFNEFVTDDIKQYIERRKQELQVGVINVFEGPITDNKGKLRLKAMEVIDKDDLLHMDWFVDNVIEY
ncbi:MAG: BMP family ABC transporter substrate-binding protein [Candidatus Cloacimonetes bacterium]|nr:BMP family ABC transporter substrate-binding protein [Candidatus Cloacimonadota bacterium]MDD2650200.1 BMP family ABC transporter substrate-binding protein [Candidatus Cloacimonadota bacterium]MDD3501830.1 BMP family ABC transporter substrate-binding protein [Candidatus Cloacimonadota bacterium]